MQAEARTVEQARADETAATALMVGSSGGGGTASTDGGAELPASPDVVADAFAAVFFLPPFVPAMENEKGPCSLFPRF